MPTLFLPLTYRGAELDGAEEHLVGTTEHSELGPRWVYDGCADPVFIGELVRVVLTGGTGVDHEYDIGNGPESRPTNAQVQGSGSASDVPLVEEVGCHDEGPLTIVNAGSFELAVARIVGTYVDAAEHARRDLEGRQRHRDRRSAAGLGTHRLPMSWSISSGASVPSDSATTTRSSP